ncbi:MAG: hypothetical protein U1F81_11550 [Verrucomicrobiaceae bacterium]
MTPHSFSTGLEGAGGMCGLRQRVIVVTHDESRVSLKQFVDGAQSPGEAFPGSAASAALCVTRSSASVCRARRRSAASRIRKRLVRLPMLSATMKKRPNMIQSSALLM